MAWHPHSRESGGNVTGSMLVLPRTVKKVRRKIGLTM